LTIHRTLRPVRFTFLIDHNDTEWLLRILQTNTCLWGGYFNAILPIQQEALLQGTQGSLDMLRYSLEALEPDYVVAVSNGLGHLLLQHGLVRIESLIPLQDVIGKDSVLLGLDMRNVYCDISTSQTPQTISRDADTVLPTMNEPGLALLSAACFGAFPWITSPCLFESEYRKQLNAQALHVDASNFIQVLFGGFHTPLRLTRWRLRKEQHFPSLHTAAKYSGMQVFLFDATSPGDIAELWNLRCLGSNVVPVPIQWCDQLIAPCQQLIMDNDAQYAGLTRLLRARSVSSDAQEVFLSHLRRELDPTIEIWSEATPTQSLHPLIAQELRRPENIAEKGVIRSPIIDGYIDVKPLQCHFDGHVRALGRLRWMNAVRFLDNDAHGEFAVVLPQGIRIPYALDPSDPLSRRGANSTSEGLILPWLTDDMSPDVRMPAMFEVFDAWFRQQGYHIRMNDKGKMVLQLVQVFGGLDNLSSIAHADIVHHLNAMAHASVEQVVDDEEETRPTRTRGMMVTYEEWFKRLQAIHGDAGLAQEHFNEFTERGVFRLGLMVKCPNCLRRNWYAPDAMAALLKCDFCLASFQFPTLPPPASSWRYRTQGVFSVENYMQGGYAVALALRSLLCDGSSQGSWVPNCELSKHDSTTRMCEIDFAIWRVKRNDYPSQPCLLLGECKCGEQTFQEADFRRAEQLLQLFPAALFVFATSRNELNISEQKNLANLKQKLVQQGRLVGESVPIVELTGKDLYMQRPLPRRLSRFP
jgi:hypothetical protein